MLCAGNPLQYCGNANRIIAYEDTPFIVYNPSDLADLLVTFYNYVAEARDALDELIELLEEYNELYTGSPLLRRDLDASDRSLEPRAPQVLLAARIAQAITRLRQARAAVGEL
jgi:hypothetical protein